MLTNLVLEGEVGIALGFFFQFFLVMTVNIIIIIGYYKLFTKCGEAGWKAIIPFYNQWVFFEIIYGKGNGWKFLLTLIPIFGFVVNTASLLRLCNNFKKSVLFTAATIIFSPICILILAFDKSEYEHQEVTEFI